MHADDIENRRTTHDVDYDDDDDNNNNNNYYYYYYYYTRINTILETIIAENGLFW